MIGPALIPARPPVLGGSIGNTRTGITAPTTVAGGGGSSPATRDGMGACGWTWGWDCGEASAASRDDDEDSPASTGATGAAGSAAGVPAVDKSAALNNPLRLSASTRS